MKQICVVTENRTKYDLLSLVMEEIRNSPEIVLQFQAYQQKLIRENWITNKYWRD